MNYEKLLGFVILASMVMVGFAGSGGSTDSGTTPTTFTFTAICAQSPGVVVESDSITVTGITNPAPIGVRNGEYSINGAPYTAEAGTVSYGQTVSVRHTTAPVDNSTVSTYLTIGGVSATFTSSTGPCLRGT